LSAKLDEFYAECFEREIIKVDSFVEGEEEKEGIQEIRKRRGDLELKNSCSKRQYSYRSPDLALINGMLE
jgi:hypothetical protein